MKKELFSLLFLVASLFSFGQSISSITSDAEELLTKNLLEKPYKSFKQINKTSQVSSLFNSGLFFASIVDTYEKYLAEIPSILENGGILIAYEALKLELDHTRLVFLGFISSNEEKIGERDGFFSLNKIVFGSRNTERDFKYSVCREVT